MPAAWRDDLVPHRSPWSQWLHSNGPLPIAIVCLLIAGAFVDEPARLGGAWSNCLALLAIEAMLVVALQLVLGTTGQVWLGQAAAYGMGAYAAAAPMASGAVALDKPLHSLCWYVAAGVVAAVCGAAAGLMVWLIRVSRRVLGGLPAALLSVMVLWCIIDISVAHAAGAKPWLTWSKLPAWAAVGHEALMAWGLAHLPATGPLWAGMLVILAGAALAGGAAAWMIGLAACGRSPMVLMLLGLVVAAVVPMSLWGDADRLTTAAQQTGLPIFTWCAIAALLAVIAVWRVRYSNIGRAMLAVRENALAAATVGVEPKRQRMLALMLCTVIAAVAGALRTQVPREIGVDEFGLLRGVGLAAVVVISGMHSISGAVLAGIVLGIVPAVWPQWQVAWYGALGLAMLVVLRLRPQGLLGARELWPLRLGAKQPRPAPSGEASR